MKYLEQAVDCFEAAGEKVIAAKTSEDVVRLTLSGDFSDTDLIEKVISSLLPLGQAESMSVFVV